MQKIKFLPTVYLIIALLASVLFFTQIQSQKNLSARKALQDVTKVSAKDTPPEPKYVPGEIIVKLKSNAPALVLKSEVMKTGKDLSKSAVTYANLASNSIPNSISKLNKQYAIREIEKVFKNQNTARVVKSKSGETISFDFSKVYVIRLEQKQAVENIISDLKNSPDFEYVELNNVYTIDSLPDDPYYTDSYPNNIPNRDPNWNPPHDYQWNIKTTNSSENWNTDTSSIVVAVIDTGVDVTHPDLGNVWVNENEIPDDGIDNDTNGCIDDIHGCKCVTGCYEGNIADDNNHGTHVAGVISAKTNNSVGLAGVTHNTKIMAVKTMGANGTGDSSYIAEGVLYAANNDATVINMSLGGSYSITLKQSLDYADSLGVILVVSAGNGNNYSYSYFPASYRKAITVAAVDEELNKVKYSNYGPNVDIAAPGGGKPCWYETKPSYCSNILSLKSSQNTNDPEYTVGGQYLRMSGTSMATPHVAGLVAYLLATQPDLTLSGIENYFRFNSIRNANNTRDENLGWGVMNSSGQNFITSSNIQFMVNYPSENSFVGKRFNVDGIISADNFDHYSVEYRAKGSINWSSTGVVMINNGLSQIIPVDPKWVTKIAEIQLPDGSLNGEYEIKTTLFTISNQTLNDTKTVTYKQKTNTWWYTSSDVNNSNFKSGGILVADLNNDSEKEIIHYNYGNNSDFGLVVFDSHYMPLWSVPQKGEVVVGDIDQRYSGKEVVLQTKDAIFVYKSNGEPISDIVLNYRSDQTNKIANVMITDADHNGKNELYFYKNYFNNDKTLYCYEQNDTQQFVKKWEAITDKPSNNNAPISGDLDGDGYMEIIVPIGNKIAILNYLGQIIVQSNANIGKMILGDINNDGKDEIISTGDGLTAYELSDSNLLVQLWNNPEGYTPLGLADFNNDSFLDVYTHLNVGGRRESIIKHDGTTMYEDQALLYFSSSPNSNVVIGDRDHNGKTEVYFPGNRNVDHRIYLLVREFDYQAGSFDLIDGVWRSLLPECGDTLTYGCGIVLNLKLALTDLEGNDKIDLIIAGVGITEFEGTNGGIYWPYVFHDFQRTNSFSFNMNSQPPSPSPTSTPTNTPTPTPTTEPTPPLAVFLDSFTAQWVNIRNTWQVRTDWVTTSEINNTGFNIWRGTTPKGPTVKLNKTIIPSCSPGGTQGCNYSFTDAMPLSGGKTRPTYYYWLEDIDLNGTVTRHGPAGTDGSGGP